MMFVSERRLIIIVVITITFFFFGKIPSWYKQTVYLNFIVILTSMVDCVLIPCSVFFLFFLILNLFQAVEFSFGVKSFFLIFYWNKDCISRNCVHDVPVSLSLFFLIPVKKIFSDFTKGYKLLQYTVIYRFLGYGAGKSFRRLTIYQNDSC